MDGSVSVPSFGPEDIMLRAAGPTNKSNTQLLVRNGKSIHQMPLNLAIPASGFLRANVASILSRAVSGFV
eukprot:3793751-Amphidinium_carterae.1